MAAGHNALYRDERSTWRQIWIVLARECPAAVIEARRYVLLACLTFMVPAAAGFALLRERPALAAEVLPDVMLRRAEAGASRQGRGPGLRGRGAGGPPAHGLGHHHQQRPGRDRLLRRAASSSASARWCCWPSTGSSIGATAGHFANAGLLDYLLEFIVGHGALELFAIWVAGAAGFLLGRAVVAPGTLSRADALVLSGRTAVRMVGAAAVLLVVAGMIEGFVSAGGYGVGLRASVPARAASCSWPLYLLNGVRGSRSIVRIRIASAIRIAIASSSRQPGRTSIVRASFISSKLGLGQQGRERVGQIVPQLAEPLGVGHVPAS